MTEPTPWEGGYICVNSCGFGGTNAHLLLKSPEIVNAPHPAATATRLVTCSGRTEEAVEIMLAEALKRPADVELQYLLQSSFASQPATLHPYRGVAILNAATSKQTIEVRAQIYTSFDTDVISSFRATASCDVGTGNENLISPQYPLNVGWILFV